MWNISILAAVMGAILALIGLSIWSYNFGDHAHLEMANSDLGLCQSSYAVAVTQTKAWKVDYDDLAAQGANDRQQASASLSAAHKQCSANADRSYQSGVLAGEAIERSKHDQSPPVAADVASHDRVCLLSDLWLGQCAAS